PSARATRSAAVSSPGGRSTALARTICTAATWSAGRSRPPPRPPPSPAPGRARPRRTWPSFLPGTGGRSLARHAGHGLAGERDVVVHHVEPVPHLLVRRGPGRVPEQVTVVLRPDDVLAAVGRLLAEDPAHGGVIGHLARRELGDRVL